MYLRYGRHGTIAWVTVLAGVLAGLLLWGLLLGASVRRHEAGLWTVRFERVIECGLDYSGPPYSGRKALWLSCGEEHGWRLWPPGQRP